VVDLAVILKLFLEFGKIDTIYLSCGPTKKETVMTNPRDQIGDAYQAEEYSALSLIVVSVSMIAAALVLILPLA